MKGRRNLITQTCMYCKFSTYKKGALGDHFKAAHQDMMMKNNAPQAPVAQLADGQWPCSVCEQKFYSAEELEVHCLTMHQAQLL